jgi:polyisoprenoid-binding protein YceI
MSSERWRFDNKQSTLEFSVRHFLLSTVRSRFGRWSGVIGIPDGDWSRATVHVDIDAASIATGIARRDEHLRAAEYLDVKRHPFITFRGRVDSTPVRQTLRLVGELTLKGQAGAMVLDFAAHGIARDPRGRRRRIFAGQASFDRRRFGLSGTLPLDSGGALIGRRIARFTLMAVPELTTDNAADRRGRGNEQAARREEALELLPGWRAANPATPQRRRFAGGN